MWQTFEIALELLNKMTNINQEYYTQNDIVNPLTLGLTKEQVFKNQEKDENIEKRMTLIDLLTKDVIGTKKSMNAIGACGSSYQDTIFFYSMYDKEVQFFSNQIEGFRWSFQRLIGNQRWSREQYWSDYENNWRDCVVYKERFGQPQGD